MPVGAVIGSAVVGAGASVYGSSKANKAAKASAAGTAAAADASVAESQRQYDITRADNAPWHAVGQGALGALAAQYGITIPADPAGAPAAPAGTTYPAGGVTPAAPPSLTAPTATPAALPGQATAPVNDQWQKYLQQNPDVAQAWETTAKLDPKYGGDINKWAQDSYELYGKREGRALPAPSPTVQPNGVAPTLPGAGPALPPRQDYTRPDAAPRPTLTRPTTAALDISPESYKASPDVQFQLDQARKGTVAGAGASGSLQSGAAAKALQDRAQNIAYGDFNGWVQRQIGIFDTANNRSDNNFAFDAGRSDQNFTYDTNRADNIFSEDRAYGTDTYNLDRNYLTDRYDTRTGNLFSLAGMGSSANSSNAAAGQRLAGTTSDALFSTAAANGKAGQAIAANNSQAVGNILGLGAGVIQNLPTKSAGQTLPLNNSTVAYAAPNPVQAWRPSNILG